ncbi:MAG: hypothetical protein LUG46_00825 [Erysipelotrichaceae bacterium]|nr:hypothetical protein [Erysipelotrichaceae bacterium]
MKNVQNTIADELDKKTQFDEQCKHILSDPQILAYIIKNCVKECHNIKMKDLVAYFETHPAVTGKEDTSISGSKIIYDIFATVDGSLLDDNNDVGLIINIEPQKSRNLPYHLERRTIHNNSRLIAQQKGIDFIKSNYNDLKKVYSIWIVYKHARIDDGVIGTISYDYKETGRKENSTNKRKHKRIRERIKKVKSDIDLSEIILIYPCEEYQEEDQSISNFFSLLFTDSKTPNEKKLLIENKYGIMMTKKKLEEVGNMCNMSAYVEDRARLNDAKIIMNKLSYTIDQTLDFLDIEDDDRPWFIDYLVDDED